MLNHFKNRLDTYEFGKHLVHQAHILTAPCHVTTSDKEEFLCSGKIYFKILTRKRGNKGWAISESLRNGFLAIKKDVPSCVRQIIILRSDNEHEFNFLDYAFLKFRDRDWNPRVRTSPYPRWFLLKEDVQKKLQFESFPTGAVTDAYQMWKRCEV